MPGGTIGEDRSDRAKWNGGMWNGRTRKSEIGRKQGRTDDQETDMTGHMTRYMPGKWIKQDKEWDTRKPLFGMRKETSHRG